MGFLKSKWAFLSPNGLCRPTKALYEDFDLKTKIWSKSSLDKKKKGFWERREEQREKARVL